MYIHNINGTNAYIYTAHQIKNTFKNIYCKANPMLRGVKEVNCLIAFEITLMQRAMPRVGYARLP